MEERISICESNIIAINETFLTAQQQLFEMVQKVASEVEVKLKVYGVQPIKDSKV